MLKCTKYLLNKMEFLSEISWESSLFLHGMEIFMWKSLGIIFSGNYPSLPQREGKKEKRGWDWAGLQLESLTSTFLDRSWIGWTIDLDGSLGFRRYISIIQQRFLLSLGKLLRYDYSLQYKGVPEIPELTVEGLACKHGTISAEMTTGISELVQLCQCSTARGEELGTAPCSYNSAASGSALPQLSLACGEEVQGTSDPLFLLFCAVMEIPVRTTSLHINGKDLNLPWCRKPYTPKKLTEGAQISLFLLLCNLKTCWLTTNRSACAYQMTRHFLKVKISVNKIAWSKFKVCPWLP